MEKWKVYIKLKRDDNLSTYRKILKEDEIMVYGRSIGDTNTITIGLVDHQDIQQICEKFSWIWLAIPISDPIDIDYPSNYNRRKLQKKRRYIPYSSNPYSKSVHITI